MRGALAIEAAGAYRRSPAERENQELSWKRTDRAFFAAGACHILAWVCRDTFATRPVGLAALRHVGGRQVFHSFATWNEWAFDHSGWHPRTALFQVNEQYERRPLEFVVIQADFGAFCAEHRHRRPDQFWADPVPRAHDYVRSFAPPWAYSDSGATLSQ